MKRRSFLAQAGTLGLGVLSPRWLATHPTRQDQGFRMAYLTDTHILPLKRITHSLTKALHHAQQLPHSPDLIMNGGDAIMDALQLDRWAVRRQWSSWQSVLKTENQLPIRHCIGNHDIWGWKLNQANDQDKVYGKQWALDELELSQRYYAFDQDHWRFVVLDSVQIKPQGYTAQLDDIQFEWLRQILLDTPPNRHICVISHIPIISATVLFDGKNEHQGGWQIPDGWMHQDARRIKNLFAQHPNVRVCMSGHTHLVDDLTYNGVRYLCNGAVSGNWWRGAFQEFNPMYAVLDFMPDGQVHREMVSYLD